MGSCNLMRYVIIVINVPAYDHWLKPVTLNVAESRANNYQWHGPSQYHVITDWINPIIYLHMIYNYTRETRLLFLVEILY